MSVTNEPAAPVEHPSVHAEQGSAAPSPQETVVSGTAGAPASPAQPSEAARPDRVTLTPDSTFRQVANHVLRAYTANLAHSARRNYANILNYALNPALGDLRIGTLDEQDLEELFSTWQDEERELAKEKKEKVVQGKKKKKKKKKGKVKRNTIDGRISVLRRVLNYATAKKLMTGDPLSIAICTLKKDDEPYEVQVLSEQEELQLLAALPRLKRKHHCLFLLLLRTGMRVGEALGLHINDVDLTARTIAIKRSWTCNAEGSPKYGSKRTIGISDDLYPVLKAYIEQIFQEQKLTWLLTTEYLFPGVSRRKPLCLMSLRRDVWAPLLADAGISKRRIHDLRHTFATTMLLAKAELHFVSRWLGHKNLNTTFDTYCHLLPKDYLLLTSMIGAPNDPRRGARPCPTCRRPLTAKLRQSLLRPVSIGVLIGTIVLGLV